MNAAVVRFTPALAPIGTATPSVWSGPSKESLREVAEMQYTRLGTSGLKVSRLGLGCMSYGQAASGMHQWALDEDAAAPFFRQAVELGVSFWDTANVYQGGTSEEFVGRAIRKYSGREDVVVATKVHGTMHDGPGGSGLSRKAILEQLDESLRRLGTDYVDVYYIHRFDDQVPVEETMQALNDVVKAGKVRYLGASSMWAWQFAKMQHVAAVNGWTTFIAMQDQYNVLKREEEREMIPLCLDQGVGLTPYSPLAKGRATRPWGEQTARSSADAVATAFDREADKPVVDAIHSIADARGIPMGQVALAWVLSKPVVSCPIVGATKPAHLQDAFAALDVKLTEDEITALEEPYTPQDNYWW
jgi:aryl-alcohol dehydrogenase-like predicted oxidoreductase